MPHRNGTRAALTAIALWLGGMRLSTAERPVADAESPASYGLAKLKVGPFDWPQWGGSSLRNNAPHGKNTPIDWEIGDFDPRTGEWRQDTALNIKWRAKLGSVTYSSPVVANGKVFIGTNNGGARLARFPADVDLGCLLCFDEQSGAFLWQHSNRKLESGRSHDQWMQGVVSVPLVDGDRLWYVSNRGEVICLDTEGFLDGENDGPFREEEVAAGNEADVVWKFDMMARLGSRQHETCDCSLTCAGDILFAATSNGVDQSHVNIPAPGAPSFFAPNRNTAELLWTDNSPGKNILHGQRSSPTYAVLGGRPQVLFGGGDGWLYSFDPRGDGAGKSVLLWKFDCNPKESKYVLGGRADRNHIIGPPVLYKGLVYVGVGEDPEHGEGAGHLWCIDPSKRGDVSAELAFSLKDLTHPIAHRRNQAVIKEQGEVARPNPNSAAVWHYEKHDLNGNGKIEFEETMHRTCGTVAIKDDLLFVADFGGLFHCLDAMTGKPYWIHDMLAACWGSPLIVEDKVYIGDEDGDMAIFALAPKKELISEINMGSSIYNTPVFANGVLYIATRDTLFAIATDSAARSKNHGIPGGATFKAKDGKVVELSFSFRSVTDVGLKEIARFADLESLCIGDCQNLTDEGLSALTTLTRLERLQLSSGSAHFSDAGLKHVAKLAQLRYLNISGERITDAGLKDLAQLSQLQTLYLFKTGVSDRGVRQLQQALPNCSITPP